ncbi:hypothetical protein [Candidatus Hodarchaeum mangrovi]
MNTTVQFSWIRLEGLGLIIASLGISFFIQIPLVYFSLVNLNYDPVTNFFALTGTVIGVSIILTSLACSIAEDWDTNVIPSYKRVTTTSIILTILYFIGYFVFFMLQPFFPLEFQGLDPQQQFLTATTLGLSLIALFTLVIYKGKNFFR